MSSFNARFVETTSCCGFQQDFKSETKQEDVTAILAQGMKHLSFDELQRAQEDLHGVGEQIDRESNPEAVCLLHAFDEHLQCRKKNTIYESAEMLNRGYVTNSDLRLQFLYGNRWDPKAAVDQFLRFLEVKKQLFGLDKVGKDITLDDLDEDDKENLLGGSLQILPWTDRSGRRIVLELPGLRSFKHLRNELRARFYLLLNTWQHFKRGGLWISYAVGRYRDNMYGKGFVEMTALAMCMPVPCAGIHLCTDDPAEAILCKAAMTLMPAELKAKTRVHYGSHTECQYLLSTFGISPVVLPFNTTRNDPILEGHMAWYRQCLKEEEDLGAGRTSDFSLLKPNQHDVLFAGRTFSGEGNEGLRLSVMRHLQKYNRENAKERRMIVDSMIEHVNRKGGRFLKFDIDGSSWIQLSMPEVREKITQMFRNLRRPRASQQQKASVTTASHLQLLGESDIAPTDILLGRKVSHDGNKGLRDKVENMAAEYDTSTRGRKKQLVESLIQEIKSSNGRFLRKLEGGKWQEVSDDAVIVSKVSSDFRNYRRTKR